MQLPANLSWIERLADGHTGTLRTLAVMAWLVRKDFASPSVRSSINNLISKRQPCQSPVAALFLFARDEIRYVNDPDDLELIRDFKHTTESRKGDCDDKVIWLATALMSIGCSVRFVIQSYAGRTWDHVYLEFYDWSKWKWIALDPTADGHGGSVVANIGWRQPLPTAGREMIYPV